MKKKLEKFLKIGILITRISLFNNYYAKAEMPYTPSYFEEQADTNKYKFTQEFWEAQKAQREKIDNRWTNTDMVNEIAWEFLNLVDWVQTRNSGAKDNNIFLRNNPSVTDIYFATWSIAHPYLSSKIPKYANTFDINWKPRQLWQMISLGISGAAVLNNSLKFNTNKSPQISIKYERKF